MTNVDGSNILLTMIWCITEAKKKRIHSIFYYRMPHENVAYRIKKVLRYGVLNTTCTRLSHIYTYFEHTVLMKS